MFWQRDSLCLPYSNKSTENASLQLRKMILAPSDSLCLLKFILPAQYREYVISHGHIVWDYDSQWMSGRIYLFNLSRLNPTILAE